MFITGENRYWFPLRLFMRRKKKIFFVWINAHNLMLTWMSRRYHKKQQNKKRWPPNTTNAIEPSGNHHPNHAMYHSVRAVCLSICLASRYMLPYSRCPLCLTPAIYHNYFNQVSDSSSLNQQPRPQITDHLFEIVYFISPNARIGCR